MYGMETYLISDASYFLVQKSPLPHLDSMWDDDFICTFLVPWETKEEKMREEDCDNIFFFCQVKRM